MILLRWAVVACIYLSLSHATASDIFFDKLKTSDDIHVTHGGGRWSFLPDGWSLGVAISESEFRQEGLGREVTMSRADIEKIWSLNEEFQKLSARIGIVYVSSEQKKADTAIGQIRYEDQRGALNYWGSLERLALIDQVRATATIGSHIMENNFSLGGSYLVIPRWKLGANLRLAELSDDNQFISFDGSLMYQVVSAGWPWIWAGYGYSQIDSQRLGQGYWSPRDFYAHGPRIDTSFPIYGAWSGIVALNVNYYNEDGTKGDGYFLVSGLQWGRYDDTNVRITYNKIRSGQGQSPWIYEGVRVSCTVFHF